MNLIPPDWNSLHYSSTQKEERKTRLASFSGKFRLLHKLFFFFPWFPMLVQAANTFLQLYNSVSVLATSSSADSWERINHSVNVGAREPPLPRSSRYLWFGRGFSTGQKAARRAVGEFAACWVSSALPSHCPPLPVLGQCLQ